MKGNVIQMNTLHLNSVRLNGIGKVQSVSLKGGSTEDPVFPPVEPPVEPEPTPTYTLSASVTNGKVSAKRNGSAVTLPYTANEGEVVVVEVTANDGYEFDGWSDGNKSNPRTIIVNEDITLNASCKEVFVPLPTYTLSASVVNGVISATLNGKAISLPYETNEGDVIVLSVTPNDGYAFDGWNDGNTDNPRTITMNADVALSAQCVEVVQPPVGNYIQFEDKNVEAICVANWSSDGIGLTEEDAAAVTTIGTIFKGNTEIVSFNELKKFTGVTSIGGVAFYGCTALTTVDISNVTSIGEYAFYGCTKLTTVDISNVTSIGGYAFGGCKALTGEFNLPNLTGTLGADVFRNTKILTFIAPNVTSIGGHAFNSCKALTTVDISNVTSIGGAAFYGCTALTTVDISNVTSIGEYAFYGCTALTSFVSRATTPPTLAHTNAFTNTNNCPIYVPDASVEAYKTATNWNQYASRIKGISEYNG